MFITVGIISLCEQELKIVRAAKTCYAGRILPTPAIEDSIWMKLWVNGLDITVYYTLFSSFMYFFCQAFI